MRVELLFETSMHSLRYCENASTPTAHPRRLVLRAFFSRALSTFFCFFVFLKKRHKSFFRRALPSRAVQGSFFTSSVKKHNENIFPRKDSGVSGGFNLILDSNNFLTNREIWNFIEIESCIFLRSAKNSNSVYK